MSIDPGVLLRRAAFRMDPERAHEAALRALQVGGPALAAGASWSASYAAETAEAADPTGITTAEPDTAGEADAATAAPAPASTLSLSN